MFAVLISEKGGAERREVFEGSEVTVGRVRGNDLVLSKGNVSKRHARLTHKDGRFVVVDQNSTNGTYVNRQRIVQATIVREGDRIYIGDFILRIEDASGPHATSDESSAARAEGETLDQPGWAGPSQDELKAPQVPPAPRLPAPLSRVPRRAEASEPEVPRPPKTEAVARQDSSPLESVRVIVERVTEKVERRTLERDIADNVARRIERVLLEEVARLRDEKGISAQITDEQLIVAARAELVGLGPLEALIRNPNATQLTANGTKSVSIVQGDRLSYAALPFSSVDSLERVLARLCRMSEASHDGRETFMTGRLQGGIIWKAVRQRAAPEGIVLVLRRRSSVEASLDELVRERTISKAMATFLTQCVSARVNVLVVGSRSSSVARVSSALALAADRQLLVLEEHFQLATAAIAAIRLDASTAPLEPWRLVDFARSLPETNLVVESLAGRSLAAVMEIIVHGFSGVVAGVNSSTVEQALGRLSTNFASLTPGVTVDTARQALASGFDLVVEVGSAPDGRDRVRRVVDVSLDPSGATQLHEVFSFTDRAAAGGSPEGTFVAASAEPRLLDELRARGVQIDTSPFQRTPSL